MTPLQIALLSVVGVILGWQFLPDSIKAKLPAWMGGIPTLDQVATTVFGALKKLQGQATLSPPGRSVLSDIAILLEEPIALFPDSPEKKAAEDGRKAIYSLFGTAPNPSTPTPAQTPTPSVT